MLEATQRSAALTSATSAVSLAIGEPDVDAPPQVVEALVDALRAGHTHYVDSAGDPELRVALARQVSRARACSYGPDEVLVTHGATAGLAATIAALVGPGDRVVLPDPTYSLYADLIRLAGGTVVTVPTLRDHHLDLEALSPQLRGARAFVYCSPANPTGAVYRREELEALAALLEGSDTIVVADEAYDQLVYDDVPFMSALDVASLRDRTVLCQTFSKTFAMTGFRVGFVVARRPVIDHIAAVHRTFNGSVNAAVQRAALRAVELGPSLGAPMLVEYERRRAVVLDALEDIPELEIVAPEGTFYAFPRVRLDHSSADLAAALLEGGVKVRPGVEFGAGGEHHLRLSFSVPPGDITVGLERLAAVLSQLGRRA
jgi:aspartate aminotransferase